MPYPMHELTRHQKQRKRIARVLAAYVVASLLQGVVMGYLLIYTDFYGPDILRRALKAALIGSLLYCMYKTWAINAGLREYDRNKDPDLLDDLYRENVWDKGNLFHGSKAVSNKTSWIVIGIFTLFCVLLGIGVLVLMALTLD